MENFIRSKLREIITGKEVSASEILEMIQNDRNFQQENILEIGKIVSSVLEDFVRRKIVVKTRATYKLIV